MTDLLVERRQQRARSGPSLTWVLFPSIVLMMVMVFLAVQLLGLVADPVQLDLEQRMNPDHLASEVTSNLPLILLIIALMGAGVLAALRLGLRPLRRISRQAAGIGPATISRRLPLSATPREIAPLVIAFNAALDRLEAGMRAQRDFSANAAHELRTPLASLRAQVENLLPSRERQEAIGEFDRLARLITQLLALAEAEHGGDLAPEPFDLVALARDLAGEMAGAVLAGGRDIALDHAVERWPCTGAPGLVAVALGNLLENAQRHTPPGTRITIAIDGAGRLMVRDDGPGIADGFAGRLFARFSKADAQGGGAGLGLSIVARVMALHGGTARLEPSRVGACFVLDFSAHGQDYPAEGGGA